MVLLLVAALLLVVLRKLEECSGEHATGPGDAQSGMPGWQHAPA